MTNPKDPTRVEDEHTSDASTVTSSGLGGGRPAGPAAATPERAREQRKEDTKRDPVMPANDETLRTDI